MLKFIISNLKPIKNLQISIDFHDFRIKVTPNPATTNLTITQEDARVDITGSYIQSVNGDSKSYDDGRGSLKATVNDITAMRGDPDYDGNAGDIRNARVRFMKGSAPVSNWMTPDLYNGRDSKTGGISSRWADLGLTKDAPNEINTETGGNGYYVRSNPVDMSLVTLYIPSGDYVVGGGYLMNPSNTSGTYAGDPGLKTNFGFVVKYKNKASSLHGDMDFLFRRTVDGLVHTYQIKSTSLTSLSVNSGSHHSMTAQIIANANLTDITNPASPVLVGSLLKLRVNTTDNGDSGASDMLAISLWNGSTLLFSSNWYGINTAERQLGSGNVIIHSGQTFGDTHNYDGNDGHAHELSAEFGVKAYPNPFTDHVYFDLLLRTDSKVRLEIYDIRGSKIATLFNDIALAYNHYQLEYTPEGVSTSVVLYKLIIDDQIAFSGKLIHK